MNRIVIVISLTLVALISASNVLAQTAQIRANRSGSFTIVLWPFTGCWPSLVRNKFDLVLTGAYTPPQILAIATTQWGLRTRQGGSFITATCTCS